MTKPLSVLLIEDNDDDALLAVLALRQGGYQVLSECVETPQALEATLQRKAWDIILSDYSMPSFNGLEALRIVKSSGQKAPFIIVSGAIGEATAVELMKNGACDYIMKDKLSLLLPAVERELVEARMRSEKEATQESLHREVIINASLAELSRNLIAIHDGLKPVAEMVLKYAKELTRSSEGYVGVIDTKTGALKPLTFTAMLGPACAMNMSGDDASVEFPRKPDGTYSGLWGHALNTRISFYENNPQEHTASTGIPEGHIRIEKFLSVPVISSGTLVGQIAVANPDHDYGHNDLIIAERLADLFSIAIANHQSLIEREQLAAQLRQVQKIEAIGTLAGGIAHDFNNILTPLIGFAEMVQMSLPRDSKSWQHQDQVLKACGRARELVQQILALSRHSDDERKPTELHCVVEEALKLLRASIPSTIEIRQHIDHGRDVVLAVPSQVHQVVMNLCTNAYHAMREKGGILGITLSRVRIDDRDLHMGIAPGNYMQLGVSDNGYGMNQQTMEKIFDPYFTTKKSGEGTGLGLSIVDSIIRKHGGVIKVYSEPGKGTSFHVYLPCSENSESGDVVLEKTDCAPLCGNEHILVVDDEVEIVEMSREILEGQGYLVTACISSSEALQAFSDNPASIDLVISDVTMPVTTGLELARQLRNIKPEIPIILYSGLSENLNRDTIASLGINRYLTKPILYHDYSQAVRQVLDDAAKQKSI